MSGTIDDMKRMFRGTRDVFIALGDEYRQEILLIFADTPQVTVKEVSERLGISRPTTSHHIKILKKAGLLGENKVGVRRYYYPTVENAVTSMKGLIVQFEVLSAEERESLNKR
jgi:ArsR family transcriptional regulator